MGAGLEAADVFFLASVRANELLRARAACCWRDCALMMRCAAVYWRLLARLVESFFRAVCASARAVAVFSLASRSIASRSSKARRLFLDRREVDCG